MSSEAVPRRKRERRRRGRARGAAFLGVLFALAMLGIGFAAASILWQLEARREREAELLFAGSEYQRALASYSKTAVEGRSGALPRRLEDLLRDPRFPDVRRHLRKLYRDPITGSEEWGLVKDGQGGISGVYSLSALGPIRRANFPPNVLVARDAKGYSDWKFLLGGFSKAVPSGAPSAMAGSGGAELGVAVPSAPVAQQAQQAPRGVPAALARMKAYQDSLPKTGDPYCDEIAINDNAACAAAAERWGAGAGATCRQSAAARLAACPSRAPMPVLLIWP